MKKIPLTKGAVALVDDADFERVSRHSWSLAIRGTAVARIDHRTVTMHRFLLDLPSGVLCDHKNRNPLDNRRENLRPATDFQNAWNQGLHRDSKTGLKGVCWASRNQRYRATIVANKKQHHLGYFSNAVDAACAYNVAAKKHFGEFACVNRMD